MIVLESCQKYDLWPNIFFLVRKNAKVKYTKNNNKTFYAKSQFKILVFASR